MDAPKTSLLARQDQLELMTTAAMPGDFFSEGEGRLSDAIFTAERFFKQRPDSYRAAVAMLGEGIGLIRIGKALMVSPNTIIAVRDRERANVDIEKKEVAGKCMNAAHLAVDAVLEDLADPAVRSEIPTRDKALIGAMLIDKAQLLRGDATIRVAYEVQEPDHNAFNQFIAGLRSANPAATGLEGERAGQKGAGLAVATPEKSVLSEGGKEV